MINETKASKLLAGARGIAEMDIESIAEAIERLSLLAIDFPQISELDINPLMVLEKGKGAIAADALVRMR